CYYVYKQRGYTINRVAQSIYTGSGTSVGLDQLAVGDIICFGNSSYVWHVGIYVGNNQFIHAPNTGAVVRVESLSGTYLNNFVCGKRIV
ncbi:MAG: C40 family peptidase, partial [Clostridiales bacterium]|nr:C40 family peptidase [Candidatus Apopatocola equi]